MYIAKYHLLSWIMGSYGCLRLRKINSYYISRYVYAMLCIANTWYVFVVLLQFQLNVI